VARCSGLGIGLQVHLFKPYLSCCVTVRSYLDSLSSLFLGKVKIMMYPTGWWQEDKERPRGSICLGAYVSGCSPGCYCWFCLLFLCCLQVLLAAGLV
jgi:hypothetical protein